MSPHSTHSADSADNEPTDHFDEAVLRRAIENLEDTDSGTTDSEYGDVDGHYDEIDLYGTLDPAPPRTTEEVPFEIVEGEDEDGAPIALLLALGALAAMAAGLAVVAVAGSLFWFVSQTAEKPADVVVAPTPVQLVGQEATNAHIDAVLEEHVAAKASSPPTFALRDVPVEFAFDSWQATIEQSALSTLATDIRTDLDQARSSEGEGKLVLTGHTDSRGSAATNEVMGLGRAWAVQVLLVGEGVDGEIELVGAGEREPIASNKTAVGRAANRRVTAEVFAPIPSLSAVLAKNQEP